MPSNDVKRKVKIVTNQTVNPDKPPIQGLPIRDWSIEVYLDNDKGENIPATIFDKVTFDLHPSFGKKAKQAKKEPPYRVAEEGWGEFELYITFTPAGKGTDVSVTHDLNFQDETYDNVQELTFKNPKPEFLRALEEAGLGAENGVKKGADKKRSRKSEKTVDMEKLADGLQKLQEEDLLQVVQMIHDQKAPETYTKNDVDAGEFHVDLYTLPDSLVKNLWDFTSSKSLDAVWMSVESDQIVPTPKRTNRRRAVAA